MRAYNPFLVALALVIAVLASHTILDVAARVHRVKGNSLTRRCWLLGGAAVIGNALWTTHFLGLLSLKIQVGASYDPWMAAFAMLVAVSLAYAALRVTTEGELSRGRIAQAGVLLGLAMVASQYLGLMSLRVRPSIGYRPAEVALSLVLALAVAGVALWITFLLPAQPIFEAKNARWAGAVVLGLGIAGVHALALQAAIFPPVAVASGVKGLGTPVLVGLIAVSCMVGVAVTLGMSVFDKRIDDLLLSAKGSLHTGTQRLNAMNGLDPVTGISSRATFLHSLEKKMTEARHDEKLLGLVFLDLDGFKTINDSLGYVGGDAGVAGVCGRPATADADEHDSWADGGGRVRGGAGRLRRSGQTGADGKVDPGKDEDGVRGGRRDVAGDGVGGGRPVSARRRKTWTRF